VTTMATTTATTTAQLQTLDDVHDRYGAILCDVWGVLHNGLDAWTQAVAALARARAAGLAVVLITNSPRAHPDVIAQLDSIGVDRAAYDRIVTSGDVTRDLISNGPDKVFFLGLERDMNLLDGLGVMSVSQDEATVVVCTGPYDDENDTPEQYRPMLEKFRARDVPFICANPDLIVERGERLVLCAGAIAAVYEEMGGQTRVSGKPHRPIYEASLAAAREIRPDLDFGRVLAIGDGMPTDVKGAQDFGLDLLYIAGGIHARDYVETGNVVQHRLDAFLGKHRANPVFWMTRLA
jgi:HAD superfamily hydrolase (TIGR01459 family)